MAFIRAFDNAQIQKMTSGKNGEYSINKINSELGRNNVLWLKENDNISLDEI